MGVPTPSTALLTAVAQFRNAQAANLDLVGLTMVQLCAVQYDTSCFWISWSWKQYSHFYEGLRLN